MSAMTIPTMAPLAMSCFGETVVGTMPDGSVDAPFSPATPVPLEAELEEPVVGDSIVPPELEGWFSGAVDDGDAPVDDCEPAVFESCEAAFEGCEVGLEVPVELFDCEPSAELPLTAATRLISSPHNAGPEPTVGLSVPVYASVW